MDKTALIYKVLSSEASEAEKRELEEWISSSKANRDEFDDLRLLRDNTRIMEEAWVESAFYEGFMQIRSRLTRRRRDRVRRKKIKTGLFVALAGTVVVALLFFYPQRLPKKPTYYKFEQIALGAMVPTLERDYDVRIEVGQERLLSCCFTGTFYNDPIETILYSVAGALNLRLEGGAEGKYKLVGEGCSR